MIQRPTCLDHGLHVLKRRSFPLNRAPKMQERHQLFFEECWNSLLTSRNPIQTKIEQHFGGFFHQIKVCHTVKRVDEVVRHPHLVMQDQFTQVSKKVSDIPDENFTINIELLQQNVMCVELLRYKRNVMSNLLDDNHRTYSNFLQMSNFFDRDGLSQK
jgi:hypothetical protein